MRLQEGVTYLCKNYGNKVCMAKMNGMKEQWEQFR